MLSKSEKKLINSLENKKYRRSNHLFIIEGQRLLLEAIQSEVNFKQIYVTASFTQHGQNNELMDLIASKAIIATVIGDQEMDKISETVTPSGILALCELPHLAKINKTETNNWIYLDEIKDPGNLGSLLRSAAWFGLNNIALSKNSIDVYNPKVVRAGMGAHFRLHIYEDIELNYFDDSHNIIGAFQDGQSIYTIDSKLIKPWVLVIGNEAHGINISNADHINLRVTIPRIGSGESLNAAIAGSIILSYLTKQL